ncbi:hypothetical protein BLNAU_12958 [Blattamonas nauphoetae]|uniref:Transmembrane protein n=1 Tax=Blattamonas nauphoetae TaxID=2049346 RepID=A0ABQ9XNB6_9EUKA|nr:hypothetical protein BLNAU_12958 [Blattamonas nauphoetae]
MVSKGLACSACCSGFSLLCAFALAMQGLGHFFELPVGEPITHKEFRNLAIYSWIAAGIWIVIGAICGILALRLRKKAKKAEESLNVRKE